MIRGTTPTLAFTLPFSAENIAELYITFTQCGKQVIEKSLDECIVESNVVKVKLTQTDTLAFSCRQADIQIRAKFTNGEAVASEIIQMSVERVLKDGEI